MDTEIQDMDLRELPDEIEYYQITDDGSLVESKIPNAVVYIDEFQIHRLRDKKAMLYIKNTYGDCIGVMRKVVFPVRPEQYRTSKMLLGVVNDVSTK